MASNFDSFGVEQKFETQLDAAINKSEDTNCSASCGNRTNVSTRCCFKKEFARAPRSRAQTAAEWCRVNDTALIRRRRWRESSFSMLADAKSLLEMVLRGEIRELIAIAANELAILERSLPWDDVKHH